MRRILPLVMALVLLAPQVALAGGSSRCLYSGQTRPRCCGQPSPDQVAETCGPTAPRLHVPPCCELVRSPATDSDVRAEGQNAALRGSVTGVPVTDLDQTAIPAGSRHTSIERSLSPPSGRQRLFLRTCALLL